MAEALVAHLGECFVELSSGPVPADHRRIEPSLVTRC